MLTDVQKAERKKGVGASDAKKIVSGQWYDLWLDKTNRKEPDEILSPWDQAVRHALEPVVLDDYEEVTGRKMVHRGAPLVHPDYDFIRCTLDGFDPGVGPIDAKALNIWTPDPQAWCIENYAGQIQHQMAVTGAKRGALHVSVGMKKPFTIPFDRDDFFLTDYLEKCREFWGYVERDEEPPQGKPMEIAPLPPVEDMRTVDMALNNRWASSATDWLENKSASDKFDAAAKALKELVEPDVRRAHGHGIEAVRNKRGLSIKELRA